MKEEKHIEALREVMETIEESLKDNRGIIAWQRRIAAMLSLGSQHIIEIYLHRKNAIKSGVQLKHEWLKLDYKNLNMRLSGILTKEISDIEDINEIFSIAKYIESDRNELMYGSRIDDDELLRKKIENFLEIKKIIENNSGVVV